MIKKVFVVLMFCILTSCNTDNFTIKPDTSKFDAKIEQLRVDTDKRIDEKVKEISQVTADKDKKIADNLQLASGLAYSIYVLNNTKLQPTRVDTLIGFNAAELVTRLPGLTPAQLIQTTADIKKELDEKATTIADLNTKYGASLEQAKKDKAAIEEAQKVIEQKKKDVEQIEKDRNSKLTDLQNKRHENDQLKINEANQAAKDAEDKKELIALLIKIFVGIGVVAAVASYALRNIVLAAASAGAFGLAIFIAFLETWMVITAGSVVVVIAIAGISLQLWNKHKEHLKESDANERLVGAIQDYKVSSPDIFQSTLATHLTAWTEDSKEFKSLVEDKLKKLNLI
jgi:hypothetical protein